MVKLATAAAKRFSLATLALLAVVRAQLPDGIVIPAGFRMVTETGFKAPVPAVTPPTFRGAVATPAAANPAADGFVIPDGYKMITETGSKPMVSLPTFGGAGAAPAAMAGRPAADGTPFFENRAHNEREAGLTIPDGQMLVSGSGLASSTAASAGIPVRASDTLMPSTGFAAPSATVAFNAAAGVTQPTQPSAPKASPTPSVEGIAVPEGYKLVSGTGLGLPPATSTQSQAGATAGIPIPAGFSLAPAMGVASGASVTPLKDLFQRATPSGMNRWYAEPSSEEFSSETGEFAGVAKGKHEETATGNHEQMATEPQAGAVASVASGSALHHSDKDMYSPAATPVHLSSDVSTGQADTMTATAVRGAGAGRANTMTATAVHVTGTTAPPTSPGDHGGATAPSTSPSAHGGGARMGEAEKMTATAVAIDASNHSPAAGSDIYPEESPNGAGPPIPPITAVVAGSRILPSRFVNEAKRAPSWESGVSKVTEDAEGVAEGVALRAWHTAEEVASDAASSLGNAEDETPRTQVAVDLAPRTIGGIVSVDCLTKMLDNPGHGCEPQQPVGQHALLVRDNSEQSHAPPSSVVHHPHHGHHHLRSVAHGHA